MKMSLSKASEAIMYISAEDQFIVKLMIANSRLMNPVSGMGNMYQKVKIKVTLQSLSLFHLLLSWLTESSKNLTVF